MKDKTLVTITSISVRWNDATGSVVAYPVSINTHLVDAPVALHRWLVEVDKPGAVSGQIEEFTARVQD